MITISHISQIDATLAGARIVLTREINIQELNWALEPLCLRANWRGVNDDNTTIYDIV